MFITFFVITVSKNVFVLPKIPELIVCIYCLLCYCFNQILLTVFLPPPLPLSLPLSLSVPSLPPSLSPSPPLSLSLSPLSLYLSPSPLPLSPSFPLSLSFQVKTENNRLLRATACECLREVELAIPVSVR